MEGFFPPDQITLPFDAGRALRAVVRLYTPIYFCGIFPDDEDVAAQLRMPFAQRRFWLPEGAVLWQVVLSQATVRQLQQDRVAGKGNAMVPGVYELLGELERQGGEARMVIAAAQGSGASALVDAAGTILTCYHVAREEADAPAETTACSQPLLPCRYLQGYGLSEAADATLGASPDYADRLAGLRLLRHVTPEEWRRGLDAAVLRASARRAGDWLELAAHKPEVGEQLWLLGFPVRSLRHSPDYPEADGTLRISTGRVTEWPSEHNFVVDADCFSGNSGGPVINDRGHLVGIVWNAHPASEIERRAIEFSGGTICVSAHAAKHRLGW